MARLGMIGMGQMGAGMTARLRAGGVEVVTFDRDPQRSDVTDAAALVEALPVARLIWLMLPTGAATRETLDTLAAHLDGGDTVVDGGNTHWRETVTRAAALSEQGIELVDAGVSGGVRGREAGYALMVGASRATFERLRPVFDALRPEGGGLSHAGPVGAGHFAKMIHNGIEYGMMQAIAEGVELLHAGGPGETDVAAVVRGWTHGAVVRSWLLDLVVEALDDEEAFAAIRAYADDSGEGRWTVEEAVATATPAPAITAALYARFASRQEEPLAMRVVAALRQRFGGHGARTARKVQSG